MADKSFLGNKDPFPAGNTTVAGDIAFGLPDEEVAPVKNKAYAPPQAPAVKQGVSSTKAAPNNAFVNNASSKDLTTIAFTPNILDNYDVYTYHWKLFMVPMAATISGKVLDLSQQTIIVESGVTDLTIDKVEISSITTPSVETGSGTSTTVKFEIVEPSGAGLLDKIFYETLALGLGNWMTNPYYLQLEFRGRDPSNETSLINGISGDLGQMKWVWPIKLTGSKVNVTHVGTRYEFDAVMYDESAQSNCLFSVQHNVTLTNLKTFDDAMQDLAKKLNEDCYEQLIDNYSIPNTYTIVVDPILGSRPLVNPDHNKNTARASDFVDFSKKTASFNSGSSIDSIINALLGSTSLGQTGLQNSKTPSSKPLTPTQQPEQMKKLWRVVTETKPIAFDPQRQDNAVAITVFVVEYQIGALEADAAQTGQTPDQVAAMKRRIDEYMNKRILRKKYNYIFTGLNDQIIALDLSMNFAFAATTARFGGVYIDSAAGSTKGVSQEENQNNEKKAGEILRTALRFINDAKPGTNVDAKIAEATRAIDATKVSPEVAKHHKLLLEKYKPENRQAFTTAITTGGSFNQDSTIGPTDGKGNPIPAAKIGSLSTSVPSDGANLTFVSDVVISSNAAQTVRAQAQALAKGKLRPIPTITGTQEGNFKGIDPASDSGRARTSSMFATALYSNLDGSMQQIKMTIKGDPFWLFPRGVGASQQALIWKSSLPKDVAIKDIKDAQVFHPESVNLFGIDNFIVLRFRTPRIYNNVTEPQDPYTDADIFNGIYKMTRIVSKFAVGKFTQDVECILDPVINFAELPDFKDFLNSIEKTNAVNDTTISPAASAVPKTAVKTEKIASDTNIPKGQGTIQNQTPASSMKHTFGQTQTIPKSNIPTDDNTSFQQII
jgi:hypothetical protein